MAIYLKKFENHTQYETYINDSGAILPNVSICTTEGDVHYNPSSPVPPTPTETRVVAKYYVDSEGSTITLFHIEGGSGSGDGSGGEPPFSSMEIDGVEQSEVVNEYTFNTTGEHTVKYTLIDPTSIGDAAFYGCDSLTSIAIPSGVTSIGNQVFYYCSRLTSIVIPDSVTTIGQYAFQGCSSLTSINIPNSVTSINDNTFDNCYGLTSCTIGSGVISIGSQAFYYCTKLTSCTIGSGVTSIGSYAFYGCGSLTSVDIPNGVTSIGYNAFATCTSLTTCTIGSGVTSIGDAAFDDCYSLTSIVSNATTAPTIASTTFQNVKTSGTLTVPQGSSGYDVWMGTGDYYLGKYNWTKVEQ